MSKRRRTRKNTKRTLPRLWAVLLTAALTAGLLTGCFQDSGESADGEKEITIAISSDTGTLDPAGSIALSWLSYAPAAMDELLTFDENGEIDLSMLPAGSYVVTEKSCDGYIIDEAQRIIELRPNEDAQYVFTNHIKPSLQLIKLSSDGSRLGLV